MPALTVTSFAAFANLTVAACKLATGDAPLDRLKALADIATGSKSLDAALNATGLAAVAAEMARTAEDHARHFTHPGPARDDAIAIFWQVAPAAFADPTVFAAAHLDPALTTDHMVAAIKASPLARDFTAAPLPEQLFRAVALATLRVMFDNKDVVAALSPALWRVSLQTTAAIKDDTAEIKETTTATEEVATEILAIVRRLAGTQEAKAALAAGVTHERILGLARRIAADVPDLDRAFAESERAVEIAAEVQTRGQAGSNTGDFVDTVLARMAALSAEGRDDEAAAEADRAFAEWQERQQLERQKGLVLLDAGLRADLLRRDPASAARRILQRIEIETPDPATLFDALRTERKEWYVRGRDKGVNLDLEVSLQLARLSAARARDRDQTGAALNDLAISLQRLGAHETGMARLEEAVAAYRAALEEYARDRTPLAWAMTQNNLGAALQTLGERESGTARLEQAVAAYSAALEEYARDRTPLGWATTQNNLGNALATLGEREPGTARLEEAVAAYRAALEERTRDRTPLDWAITQNNLGNAFRTLGEREPGTARLKEAVAAYRAALEERTRDRMPLAWAMTQNNLGNALRSLGEREPSTARLEEAVAAYSAALEECTRDRTPRDWAMTQNNLGAALSVLGARESSTARLEEAVAACRAALEECTCGRTPLEWGMIQNNLGNALAALGERESGTARLEEAVAAYRAALEERTRDRMPLAWATIQNNLGNALRTLGARETGTARLEEAVAAYRAALEERTCDRTPLDWATSTGNQGVALRLLAERTADIAMARRARDQIAAAEAKMRAGGHAPFRDYYAAELPAAEALIARLAGA